MDEKEEQTLELEGAAKKLRSILGIGCRQGSITPSSISARTISTTTKEKELQSMLSAAGFKGPITFSPISTKRAKAVSSKVLSRRDVLSATATVAAAAPSNVSAAAASSNVSAAAAPGGASISVATGSDTVATSHSSQLQTRRFSNDEAAAAQQQAAQQERAALQRAALQREA